MQLLDEDLLAILAMNIYLKLYFFLFLLLFETLGLGEN